MSETDAKLYDPFAWSTRGIVWARDFPAFCQKAFNWSENARASLHPITINYGLSSEQRIEWFRLDGDDNPVFVFLHGGGFQAGDVASSGYMAEHMAEKGIETAVLGYDLCPNVTLQTIVDQVHQGLKELLKNLRPHQRLFISGVSAGATLSALLLCSFFSNDRVAGYFLLAGLYDFRPIQGFESSQRLSLTEDNSEKLSPMCHSVGKSKATAVITVGGDESPAFKKQAADFAQKLRDAGWENVLSRTEENKDHLHMSEIFGMPNDDLMKVLVDIMKRSDSGK